MQSRRMVGKFVALPHQIIDILEGLSAHTERLYISLLRHYFIDEDWEVPGDWVKGTIRTTKTDIIRFSGIGEGTFWRRSWPSLLKTGLVIDNKKEGTITLPMLKKKDDLSISPKQIQDHEARLGRLEDILLSGDSIISESSTAEVIAAAKEAIAARAEGIGSDDPFKGLKKRKDKEEKEEPIDPNESDYGLDFNGVVDLIRRTWPGYNLKKSDHDAVAHISGFRASDVKEAFAAAKKAKVKRGCFDWILNRLENPDLYRKPKKLRRIPRKTKKIKAGPDICLLEAPWLSDGEKEESSDGIR